MYPNPGFPIYESVINYTGATPVPIALKEEKGFAFDAEAVLSRITKNKGLSLLIAQLIQLVGVTPNQKLINWLQD